MLFVLIYILIVIPVLIIAPVKVIGKKNFKRKQKNILVCNHQSNFDPVILDIYLRKRIRFVAKKELWKGKEKSLLFETALGCIPVDRSKGLTMAATKKIYEVLKNNETLGLFPEGKRFSGTEHEMSVKNGACMFAIKTKTPILPCFILKHQKLFRFNKLIVGEPFELSEYYDKKLDKETLDEASQVIIEKLTALKTDYENKKMVKKLNKKAKN